MPPRDSPHILIRLEQPDKEALRQLAAEEGCDMTAIVRPLILKRLGREEAVEGSVIPAGIKGAVKRFEAALPLARKMVTTRFKKGK